MFTAVNIMAWVSVTLFVATLTIVHAEYTIKCDEGGCNAEGKGGEPSLIQGDILVDEDSSRNAIFNRNMLWPNGVVPYVFHQSINQTERNQIRAGMQALSSRTCVKFKERTSTSQEKYLMITKEMNGCYANVGYIPNSDGYTRLNLQNPGCFSSGTIQHELLHVLGLYHEQARPDRDSYVNIHWNNIEAGRESNFAKRSTSEATTYNLPYDFQSLMHYGRFDFSKSPNLQTITAKANPGMTLGQDNGPTFNDLEKIKKMYTC